MMKMLKIFIICYTKIIKEINVRTFFEEELFFSKENFDSKEMVIHFLSDKLVEKGYADKKFESLVLNREIMAPTAYGNLFAMPHPIKKEGIENKIAVCSLNKSIIGMIKKLD